MARIIQFDADASVTETDHKAAIHVLNTTTTDYGPKAQLETPYSAKDDIKSLDWDETHRSWNGACWTVDFEALPTAVKHLVREGHRVTVPKYVLRDYSERYGSDAFGFDIGDGDDENGTEDGDEERGQEGASSIRTSELVTVEEGDSYLNIRPIDGEGFVRVRTLEIPDFYLSSARWSLASEAIRYDDRADAYEIVARDSWGEEMVLATVPASLVDFEKAECSVPDGHDAEGDHATLEYEEGVFSRWQKYGKDRLYVRDGEGYIDIETGTAHGVELHSIDFEFGNERGNIVEKHDDEYRVYQNDGARSEWVVARIPVPESERDDDPATDGGGPTIPTDGGEDVGDSTPTDETPTDAPEFSFGERPLSDYSSDEIAELWDRLESDHSPIEERLEACAEDARERGGESIESVRVDNTGNNRRTFEYRLRITIRPAYQFGREYCVPRQIQRWADANDLVLRNVAFRSDDDRMFVSFAALEDTRFDPRTKFADALRPYFEAGCSVAEAVDAWMTDPEWVSDSYWAEWRGLTNRQSVNRNKNEGRRKLGEEASR